MRCAKMLIVSIVLLLPALVVWLVAEMAEI